MYLRAASNLGRQEDVAFFIVVSICVVLFLVINALMVYFVIRYKRKKNPRSEYIEGSTLLETAWTIGPIILVTFIFYIGLQGYRARKDAPPDAFVVKVNAQMWSWSFQYENGKVSDVLNLPLNKAVILKMYSIDAIHSFFAPAFRVKGDVVPGRENRLWLIPIEKGEFDIFCTELCGIGHYTMHTTARVMDEAAFKEWYEAPGR